jgi:hypothetical protein
VAVYTRPVTLPPAQGFGICFLLLKLPRVVAPVIVPPFFIPCPGECVPPPTGLMPPGCP